MRKEYENKGAKIVYTLYEKSIRHGVSITAFNNPWNTNTMKGYKILHNNLRVQIHKRKKAKNDKELPEISEEFRKLCANDYQSACSTFKFERKMLNVKLQCCSACNGTFLSERILKGEAKNSVCDACQYVEGFRYNSKSNDSYSQQLRSFYLQHEMLPVWYEEDDQKTRINPHFEIPNELKDMTFTEQMLIQLYSAYVPVFCINGKGNIGYKGHCVCFPQDIQCVCNTLPRQKSEIVRVIKTYMQCNDVVVTHFKVRKTKVLNALSWLKRHNKYYKNISIDESNLSWMTSDVDNIIDGKTITTLKQKNRTKQKETTTPFLSSANKDYDTTQSNSAHFEHIGLSNNSVPPTMNENDKKIKEAINQKLTEMGEESTLMFPNIASNPVTEYDEDIFPKIFPTLYPGGIGGFNNNIAKVNKKKYGKRLLSFKDGRFATNKIWSFYMMDVIQRDQNNRDGNFVLKDKHFGKQYQTLEDLIEKLDQGDMSWINMIRNYSNRIRGSDNYWRSKKYELESWVKHHVSKGHGPPTLFVTLSCAENWWPDLKRLLIDRLLGTEYEHLITSINSDDLDESIKATRKAADLFSIIVQQFFQIRVNEWIDTFAREALDIEFYWGRYEFTKGRGQIHLHMLCITKNRHYMKQYYECKQKNNIEKAVSILSEYAEVQLGLTAEHPSHFQINDMSFIDTSRICEPEGNADIQQEMKLSLTKRLCEVSFPKDDLCSLCNATQIHQCNAFCMRKTKIKNKDQRRFCRVGCGVEETIGANDTPGFPLVDKNNIVVDSRRYIKLLKLKRKGSRRFVQSSTKALQSWRANCDVQIIIYDSDPNKPNLEEIRRVSDYVVAYTTKVNQTIAEERRVCLDIAKAAMSEYSSENENLVSVIKKILNSFNGKRIIPRPEVMVELDLLPLTICSEKIETINISSSCKVFLQSLKGDPKKYKSSKTFISKYATRKDNFDLSLIEYFYKTHQEHIIPHPVGRKTSPSTVRQFDGRYTVHPEFKKSMLILYKPWKLDECLSIIEDNIAASAIYNDFVKSNECPKELKDMHKLALNYDGNNIEKLSEKIEFENYQRFCEGYTPSNKDEEEDYFTFLRSKALGDYFTYHEHTVKIDHTIKWWERECDVCVY